LKSAPLNPPNMNYLAIFCQSQLKDPQAGPCGLKVVPNYGRAMQVEKNSSQSFRMQNV